MLSRLSDLDTVSNNLANVNTAGFKQSRANFQELLTQGSPNGVQLSATQVMADQGAFKTTDNPLDLAVSGNGFFAVTLPDGKTAYTRDGELHIDPTQGLVNASGYRLVWQGSIPANSEEIQVQPDGTVRSRQGTTWVQVGTIPLSVFTNPSGLQSNGENLWLASAASSPAKSGTPGSAGFGKICASTIEQSNVNLADEMTHLMSLQQAFQMSVRTFQQTDGMISEAIHMRKA